MKVNVTVNYAGPVDENWTKQITVNSFFAKKGSYNVSINQTDEKTKIIVASIKKPQATVTMGIKGKIVSIKRTSLSEFKATGLLDILESIKWKKQLDLSKIGSKIRHALQP